MLIENVGKHFPRADHILGTSRVWATTGAVLEVPDAEAAHYLAYPDVWKQTTPEEQEAKRRAREEAGENVAKAMAACTVLSSAEMRQLVSQIEITIKRREEAEEHARRSAVSRGEAGARERAKRAEVGITPVAPKVTEDPEAKARRAHAIALAVSELDKNDDAHFNGFMPIPEKVAELTGFTVTEHECVIAVLAEMKKAELIGYANKIGLPVLPTATVSILRDEIAQWVP